MRHSLALLLTLGCFLTLTLANPLDYRKSKALYFDYVPNGNDYEFDLDETSNFVNEDLARTIGVQRRKPQKNTPFNSPIYYIALPPQPYIFVPGMGYMSQPPPNPTPNFLNLPVNFLANGKPSQIYQWSGGHYSNLVPTTTEKPVVTDSPIINLDNKLVFNGKPGDTISILRDSYNALYSDALQNFYP